jgi:cellobiose epimerase
MNFAKYTLSIFLSLPIANSHTVAQSGEGQYSWPDGKQVAISLTFDDGRTSQVDGGTALLDQYGFKATFYVVPSAVEKKLDGWKKAVAAGHEIGNHSLKHPCSGNFQWSRPNALENYSIVEMRNELLLANSAIEQLLGTRAQVFAYPCGQKFTGRGKDVKSYVPLVAELFLTGRGWLDEGPNDPMFCDFSQLTGMESDAKDFPEILKIIEAAKKNKQWLVLAGHEMAESGPQTTRLSMLKQLFEYAKDPANGVWIAPVGTVAKYLQPFRQSFETGTHNDERSRIAGEMEKSLKTELLDAWYPHAIDRESGGFLSSFTFDFKPAGNQDKMIVTQSRHIWTNAKASILFPDIPHYRTSAAHGLKFLKDVMWDKTYGGFYTLVDRKGKVKEGQFAPKEAYGNAFALFALAAYYQAFGDTSALNLAKKQFMWLEKHSHDPVHKGYFQHLYRDGTPEKRDPKEPSTSVRGLKDQNTSIHLLEAFTELYAVWPDPLVRERLNEMLVLIRDRITTPQGYLTLFLLPDWTPISFKDSSEASILRHRNVDHVSFGHDVETAFLMIEASHVLGNKHDNRTMQVAKTMVDHALRNGWDNSVGGVYDEGYYFKDKPGITIIRDTKNWWAQAETLNTLLLMADLYPDDAMQYFEKFKTLWKYAQEYLIDHEYGDWYAGGLDKEPQHKKSLKGHIWKAAYHQYRSVANCIQRLKPDRVPPGIPENVKLKRNVISWIATSDDRTMLGYNIYSNGKRVGFTPLTAWAIERPQKASAYFITAVDLQGNESAQSATVK